MVRILKIITVFSLIALVAPPALYSDRIAPKEVTSVIKNGIKYLAPHDQMGCVEARSEKTGQLFWRKQIYVVRYWLELEEDVQYCYITSIRLTETKMLVKNEEGFEYELDLDSLSVKALKGKLVIDRT